jgi:nucleotide-binding universal stress UspA family protein
VSEGPIALTLLELGRHADPLVVGSRGRGSFVEMLLGSVSQHVVNHAVCPVVVVPERIAEAEPDPTGC